MEFADDGNRLEWNAASCRLDPEFAGCAIGFVIERRSGPFAKGNTVSQGRRVHDRFETVLPVTVTIVSPSPAAGEVAGSTLNISLGGMLLEVTDLVPFGADVRVRVTLPALKEQSELPATVRWAKPGSIGVQFGSLRAKEVWALNQLFRNMPKLSDADSPTAS